MGSHVCGYAFFLYVAYVSSCGYASSGHVLTQLRVATPLPACAYAMMHLILLRIPFRHFYSRQRRPVCPVYFIYFLFILSTISIYALSDTSEVRSTVSLNWYPTLSNTDCYTAPDITLKRNTFPLNRAIPLYRGIDVCLQCEVNIQLFLVVGKSLQAELNMKSVREMISKL